ncbi:MAG: KH domain-containing protein [Candidatus Bathyarchaeota archaeon]|jgi:ribosomal RNA assembly protein|nr:RNA-processing protein [Candidatus Bathyarchaeota archaeon A05DMB-3]MDH7606566.1 KH domain-containing protein [Candidatus Bathyarchaeota archaeon]
MAQPSTFVRIPKERVGVLIGQGGETKRAIEKMLSVTLDVESDGGGVTIMLSEKAEDPSVLLRAKEVATAIGRGFSPEHAFRLIHDEETVLDIIDLRTIFGRSESDIRRVKGRIIGMEGKTRRIIEELTDTNIAVYGHTVGIIGKIEHAQVAREAIQMLIQGSQHATVYRFLHRKRRELKKGMLEIWEKPED